MDIDPNNQWWFNLRTQQVEHGVGAPNSERLGPYATEAEAAAALELARERTEAWDAEDEEDD